MEFDVWREMISVIRVEQKKRGALSPDEDVDSASDRWLFKDQPFINELCLMLLVALWHQLEREVVSLAARSTDDGQEINYQQYEQNVEKERKTLGNNPRGWWKTISARFRIKSCEGHKSIDTLRLLANSYKHDPAMKPQKKLLEALNLNTEDKYARLPESESVQKAFATSLGLGMNASYCDIAGRCVDIASNFFLSMESQTTLSPIKPRRVSMMPRDFEG
jgi:hypothetical protein